MSQAAIAFLATAVDLPVRRRRRRSWRDNHWHTLSLAFKGEQLSIRIDDNRWSKNLKRPGFAFKKKMLLMLMAEGNDGIEARCADKRRLRVLRPAEFENCGLRNRFSSRFRKANRLIGDLKTQNLLAFLNLLAPPLLPESRALLEYANCGLRN